MGQIKTNCKVILVKFISIEFSLAIATGVAIATRAEYVEPDESARAFLIQGAFLNERGS